MIIRQTAALIRKLGGPTLTQRPRFTLLHDQIGQGYGYGTRAAAQGAEQVARFSGAPGEVTYSGKALAALQALSLARPEVERSLLALLSSVQPPLADTSTLPKRLQRVLEKTNHAEEWNRTAELS